MSSSVSRYRPSRRYYFLLMLASVGIAVSVWSGVHWPAAWLAAAGFAVPAIALLALVLQPSIDVHESHLKLGRRKIAWSDIRRLDRTGWNAPLVLRLTVAAEGGPTKFTLIYPGDLDACRSLLRHLRRYSSEALLDGVPYPKFWGETSGRQTSAAQPASSQETSPRQGAGSHEAAAPRQSTAGKLAPARHRLLLPEDEAEVERMFQRLKSDGHLEQDGPIGQHGGGPRGERSPEEK